MERSADLQWPWRQVSRTQGKTSGCILLFVLAFLTLAGGIGYTWRLSGTDSPSHTIGKNSTAERILKGAKKEVEKKTVYKETYEVLDYPMGDVPPEIGVCTDLIVRAFRNADIDLQKLLHEDRVQNPGKYPIHLWERREADKNIDHRRCQNLVVFFKRFAQSLDKDDPASWKPGDVIFVIWGKRDYPTHVGIISDRKDTDGSPLLCHLYPPSCHEAPVSRYGPVYGVYRWPEAKTAQATPGVGTGT